MHGTEPGSSVLWVLLWSAGFLLVFAPMAMRLYNTER